MAEDDLTIFVLLNATGEILGLAPIKKIVQIKKKLVKSKLKFSDIIEKGYVFKFLPP